MIESQRGDFVVEFFEVRLRLTYVEICVLWKSAKSEGEETISGQPRLCPQIFDSANTAMNSFGNRKFHAANGKVQHAVVMMGPSFSFGGPWGKLFFCFSSVFNLSPCHWPRPKMVTNSFGNQKYMQPVGRLKHALKVPWFYFILSFGWGSVGRIFFHFSFVLNMLLLCSFQVLNGFPSGVP